MDSPYLSFEKKVQNDWTENDMIIRQRIHHAICFQFGTKLCKFGDFKMSSLFIFFCVSEYAIQYYRSKSEKNVHLKYPSQVG
jgi:hypothetical protein